MGMDDAALIAAIVKQDPAAFEQAYDRYAIRLQDAREQEIFAQRDLKVVKGNSGSAVLVTIPALRLRTGMHLLTLDGLADTGEREPVSKLEINVTRK